MNQKGNRESCLLDNSIISINTKEAVVREQPIQAKSTGKHPMNAPMARQSNESQNTNDNMLCRFNELLSESLDDGVARNIETTSDNNPDSEALIMNERSDREDDSAQSGIIPLFTFFEIISNIN